MSGDIDIGAIDRRARAAGYSDGLMEIFAAVVLLTMALGLVAYPSFVAIWAAFIVLYGWRLVDRVKARVTYPRIGYYRERSDEPGRAGRGMLFFAGGAFLLMVLVVLVSGGFSDATSWRRAAPLVSGVSVAGGFWYVSFQSGLLRYRIIAGLSVVGGLPLWWLGSGESYAAVAWHLVALAVLLAIVGIWSLVRFLRTYPVRELPGDG